MRMNGSRLRLLDTQKPLAGFLLAVTLRAYALEGTWPATLFHTYRIRSGQVWRCGEFRPRATVVTVALVVLGSGTLFTG